MTNKIDKKESVSLIAVFDALKEKKNVDDENTGTIQNTNPSKNNLETGPEECEEYNVSTKQIVNTGNDFSTSMLLMKALKPEHKTKMEVSSATNKKVVIISRILGVNAHALIDIALNEFLERNKKEIDRAMKQAMK